MDITETCERLRGMAEELEGLKKKLSLPVQHVDIPGAFAKLRAVLGKSAYISIDPPEFNSHGHSDKIVLGEWRVYDGSKSHEGATLAEAVNKALAANAPKPQADPVEAMNLVTEALAEPIPM